MAFPKHGLVATSLDIPDVGVLGIHLDASGIGAGGTTSTNGPFKVTPAGALTASGADITGAIHATSGDISGDLSVSGTLTLSGVGAALKGSQVRIEPGLIIASTNPGNPFGGGAVSTVLSAGNTITTEVNVRVNSSDSDAAVRITNGANGIQFGPGGSGGYDVSLERGAAGRLDIDANVKLLGNQLGFFGHATGSKPNVGGSRGGNNALNQLVQALDGLGLITNSTTV